jgi:hypothetical protein
MTPYPRQQRKGNKVISLHKQNALVNFNIIVYNNSWEE